MLLRDPVREELQLLTVLMHPLFKWPNKQGAGAPAHLGSQVKGRFVHLLGGPLHADGSPHLCFPLNIPYPVS